LSLDAQPETFTDTAPPRSMARPNLGFRVSVLRDVLEVLMVIVSIYTTVNLASARAIVEGGSMLPNFDTGQLIIVNRIAYFYSKPERGDVIVLHNPRNAAEDYIKRVIGLPGETVQISGGYVYVDGKQLYEPYLDMENFCYTCEGTWLLGADEYFVLGDNRRNSTDSHIFGAVKQDVIIGKAWLRYWPTNSLGLIPHEDYTRQGGFVPRPLPSKSAPMPSNPNYRGKPISA
jgi:signal peptidase I